MDGQLTYDRFMQWIQDVEECRKQQEEQLRLRQ